MKWIIVLCFPILFIFLILIGGADSESKKGSGGVIALCEYTSDKLDNKQLENQRNYVKERVADEQLINAILGIYGVNEYQGLDHIINTINHYYVYVTERGERLGYVDYIQAYVYGTEYLDYVLEQNIITSLKNNKAYEEYKGIAITEENKDNYKFYMRVLSAINPNCTTGIDGLPLNKPYVITGWFPNYNADGTGDIHYGIDFGMPEGTDIFSIADGEVVSIGNSCPWNDGFVGNTCGVEQGYTGAGNFVYYKFEQDGSTYYVMNAHMKNVNVASGEHITKGQKIGTVGNSGNSTGSHLHFEIHKDSTAIASNDGIVNPCEFIEGLCTDYQG